jgi:hypothetical protein
MSKLPNESPSDDSASATLRLKPQRGASGVPCAAAAAAAGGDCHAVAAANGSCQARPARALLHMVPGVKVECTAAGVSRTRAILGMRTKLLFPGHLPTTPWTRSCSVMGTASRTEHSCRSYQHHRSPPFHLTVTDSIKSPSRSADWALALQDALRAHAAVGLIHCSTM